MGEIVFVCTGVVEPWPDEVAWRKGSLLGALEEWLLLAWRENMNSGRRLSIFFPSIGGLTPSRTMIFITRPQKGIHVCAADRAAVFPIIWKMWAHMSIGAPVMRSHRNWALSRLMNAVFESGYRLKNMINLRVFNSCANFAVPMDVPLLMTSWSSLRTWRMSCIWGCLSSYGVRSTSAGLVMQRTFANVVWIDGELFFAYPTLQLNFGISSIWIEFLDQFINRVLKVLEQISPIFYFKYPRNKCSSQGQIWLLDPPQ